MFIAKKSNNLASFKSIFLKLNKKSNTKAVEKPAVEESVVVEESEEKPKKAKRNKAQISTPEEDNEANSFDNKL